MRRIAEVVVVTQTLLGVAEPIGQVFVRKIGNSTLHPARTDILPVWNEGQGVASKNDAIETAKEIAQKNGCAFVFRDKDLAQKAAWIRNHAMNREQYYKTLRYIQWLRSQVNASRLSEVSI